VFPTLQTNKPTYSKGLARNLAARYLIENKADCTALGYIEIQNRLAQNQSKAPHLFPQMKSNTRLNEVRMW
jgi:hypothetical protein